VDAVILARDDDTSRVEGERREHDGALDGVTDGVADGERRWADPHEDSVGVIRRGLDLADTRVDVRCVADHGVVRAEADEDERRLRACEDVPENGWPVDDARSANGDRRPFVSGALCDALKLWTDAFGV
jgi:hypothetical protein